MLFLAHFAHIGELDRIAGQVDQNLVERAPVALHDDRLLRAIEYEAQAFLLGQWAQAGRHFVDDSLAHDRRQGYLDLARLDLGQIEDVVDPREQMPRAVLL
jgi:hypothetical protein